MNRYVVTYLILSRYIRPTLIASTLFDLNQKDTTELKFLFWK